MAIDPKIIDHTNLALNATEKDIENLCKEAKEYGFGAVCVRPNYVTIAKAILKETAIKVCTVIGFPKGLNSTEEKVLEAKKAIEEGADELDMVINIEALKRNDLDYVKKDIYSVKQVVKDKILKVIIEAGVLAKKQKKIACRLVEEAGADFVKTSTGFAKDEKGNKLGATLQDVKIIKRVVGDRVGIKAAGGVNTYEFAARLIEAGATRLGSSTSVALISNLRSISSKEVELQLQYAWEWFKYHADQRLRAFYYYLIIVGALALGYLTAIQNSGKFNQVDRMIPWLFIFSFIVSLAFLCLEIRNVELVNIGRNRLEQAGLDVSINDACREYTIALEQTLRCRPKLRFLFKHELWLRLIYILVAFFSLYLYFDSKQIFIGSFWESWVPLIILIISIVLSLWLGWRRN